MISATVPSHTERTASTTLSARWWELALLASISLAALCAMIVFYDDVHRVTTNGLWKSIDVSPWVTRDPQRMTFAGNLLYYPAIGALVRALPESMFGAVWQRMAYLNAGFGAGVVVLMYVIALKLFQARVPALFACFAQFSMAFFLLLSTINEDIMPGYFWFVAATALTIVPARLGPVALVAAAQCLALSWLFHSSLQLPGIGALSVGILLRLGSVRRAIGPVAGFLLALIPLPIVSALLFGLPWSEGWWSGKGLGTGWGGFSANKIVFMWSGISQSVAGGQNLGTLVDVLGYANLLMTSVTSVIVAALFGLWLWTGARRRDVPEWRCAVGLLTAVFALGEGMNLYIQPQDPQMQIQPMTWFPLAATCAFVLAGSRATGWRTAWQAALVGASALLMAFNLSTQTTTRGADTVALRNIEIIRKMAPPERTVFLLHGFEGMATWLTVAWGAGTTDAPSFMTDGPGRYNAIYVANQATVNPDWPPDMSAMEVVRLVDHALSEGFDVVTSEMWNAPESAWVDGFATVSGPDKPLAIRAALHEHFTATELGVVPGWASLYRVTRKPGVSPSL